jgi:hypothetical protein
MSNKPNIRLQPHLGRVKDNYKPHNDMGGVLAVAKVLKVHHKQGTVDLQVIKTNDVISSDTSNEGKFAARVLTTSAHFDNASMSSSGVVEPIQEGQMVLLAFIDGLKANPIVLGSFHQTWSTEQNILPSSYPLDPEEGLWDRREALKYLRVHPSQFYQRIDGIGAMEMSHPSKTFLQIDPDLYDEGINDEHGGYDHSKLNEKDPQFGGTRSGRTQESTNPVNVLFVHRSSPEDETTTWTKFFINAQGMFRVTRDNNDNSLSYLQMTETGDIKIRRQIDSPVHEDGNNYSEISLAETGGVSIARTIDGNTSSVSVDDNGDIILQHSSGKYIKIDGTGVSGDGVTGGGGGTVGGGGFLGYYVSATEPDDAPDGTFWIDTSDLGV